jgi:hypothetical protein
MSKQNYPHTRTKLTSRQHYCTDAVMWRHKRGNVSQWNQYMQLSEIGHSSKYHFNMTCILLLQIHYFNIYIYIFISIFIIPAKIYTRYFNILMQLYNNCLTKYRSIPANVYPENHMQGLTLIQHFINLQLLVGWFILCRTSRSEL